ncbi:MAG TPA: DNA polymerase IV [Polyangiaceae bacterium]|nr:DNA polymerase IV [Polyangiaceae bacterium]
MTSAAERWILHADMDAFYASIEQRDHPELRGKPVIVGASSKRGVVAAASYEARVFGVRSAMPGFRARELCPDGVFLPSNMAHYVAVSAEVHAVFERFTPEIEPIALDEAFLDITGSLALFGAPQKLAAELKRAVREATALNVSVGLAPNKLVAKLACTLGKPDGLKVIEPHEVRAFVDPLPIRRLWGVGPVLGAKLASLGVETFSDLSSYHPNELANALGERGAELQRLARGEDDRPVLAYREPKSYGEESTFESDVSDRTRVTAALTEHAETVARRLRHDDYAGRTVTIKAKLGRARGRRESRDASVATEPYYPLVTRSRTLPQATSDGALIRQVAVELWDEAKLGEPVRLLGVSLSNLERGAGGSQLELFAAPKSALGKTLDAITERFGERAISRAVGHTEKLTPGRTRKRGT